MSRRLGSRDSIGGSEQDGDDEHRQTHGASRRADRPARRVLGRPAPGAGDHRGGVARRALRRALARRQGQPGPAQPHAPGGRRRDPPRLLRGRGGHRNHEHLHGDLDRPGRLRARGRRLRDEPGRRASGARGGGRGRRLRRGLGRALERGALALAQGGRSELPLGHVRPGTGVLCGADPCARGGRRRPAADRDRLRHAQRQGGDRGRAGRRAGPAALAVVHRDRPVRPQSLRADRRGVLGLGRAREAAGRRRQLLARRRADAAVRARPRADRVHLRRLPPECGAPERDGDPRRAARRHQPLPGRVRPRRPRQPRRRLLRDTPGARRGDQARGRRRPPAHDPDPGAAPSFQRPGAVRDRRRHGLRDDRRAHERHGLRPLPQADRGGRLHGRRRGRGRAGARRGQPARREHGRRPARVGAGDDDVPERDRDRAGGGADPDHGRQLAALSAGGRAQVRPGQGRGQLDQPQGGRGGVPRPGRDGPPLRRRRDRDGLRRARPGRHGRAEGRDLRPRVRPAHGEGRVRAGGHRLRPQRARRRHGHRGAQRVRQGVHPEPAADQGALPGRAHERRDLQPLLRVPRQRRRARGDALVVPVPRDQGGPGHGHRQRRPARRLRGHPTRPARAGRGRDLQPSPGGDRAPGRVRTVRARRGHQARARPLLARGAGRGAPLVRARPRRRRLHRGRHRGGKAEAPAAARRDRGAADAGHAGRRRPVRLGADVPAAGGEERPRDEACGGVPGAVHGGGEGAERRRRPAPRARSSSPPSRATSTTSARTSSASCSAATATRSSTSA